MCLNITRIKMKSIHQDEQWCKKDEEEEEAERERETEMRTCLTSSTQTKFVIKYLCSMSTSLQFNTVLLVDAVSVNTWRLFIHGSKLSYSVGIVLYGLYAWYVLRSNGGDNVSRRHNEPNTHYTYNAKAHARWIFVLNMSRHLLIEPTLLPSSFVTNMHVHIFSY